MRKKNRILSSSIKHSSIWNYEYDWPLGKKREKYLNNLNWLRNEPRAFERTELILLLQNQKKAYNSRKLFAVIIVNYE